MPNVMSFTSFLHSLGYHLKIGYHWSAMSYDRKSLIITVWEDEIEDGQYVVIPQGSPMWMRRPGGHKLRDHVAEALENGIEVLGVLCVAEDIKATTRRRKNFDQENLLHLKLVRRGDSVTASIIAELETGSLARRSLLNLTEGPRSALDDLDEIPAGAQTPETYFGKGKFFKRSKKVRDYVLKKANGTCEYCGSKGFLMKNGSHYLEAHHIIGLGKEGPDTVDNVIAVCPTDHRSAHFAANALDINNAMQAIVKKRQETIAN